MSKNLPGATASDTKGSQSFFENRIAESWITKKELAARLSFSISNIDRFIKKGWIPYKKLGRAVRFRFTEVAAALEKRSAT